MPPDRVTHRTENIKHFRTGSTTRETSGNSGQAG